MCSWAPTHPSIAIPRARSDHPSLSLAGSFRFLLKLVVLCGYEGNEKTGGRFVSGIKC